MGPREYAARHFEIRAGWSGELEATLRVADLVQSPRTIQREVLRAVLLGKSPGRSGPIRSALAERYGPRAAADWAADGMTMITEVGDDDPISVGLVLVPGLNRSDAGQLSLVPTDDAADTWKWLSLPTFTSLRSVDSEAVTLIPIPVVVGPKPTLIRTAATGDHLDTPIDELTVGAPAQHVRAGTGFLTAAHGIPDRGPFGVFPNRVNLDDGTTGRVTNIDRLWDAAFVSYPRGLDPPSVSMGTATSVPAVRSGAGFIGWKSGPVKCEVEAADPILPQFHLRYATGIGRLYTKACTQPGDSGAVLVSAAGEALGQSTLVSRPEDSDIHLSIWTWMAGIEAALAVRVL